MPRPLHAFLLLLNLLLMLLRCKAPAGTTSDRPSCSCQLCYHPESAMFLYGGRACLPGVKRRYTEPESSTRRPRNFRLSKSGVFANPQSSSMGFLKFAQRIPCIRPPSIHRVYLQMAIPTQLHRSPKPTSANALYDPPLTQGTGRQKRCGLGRWSHVRRQTTTCAQE
ncbi:uncharacterized protein BDZ83DRAFT_727681 [Colletotrichum acutatum]|uniref:Secreted protein n=1 Tax=Glomerella acutata TaxID=27357 RepID=A0AAD8XKE2_GLOAC|nr:uncharacterized protein BDZ83DRAFT_727681 [Colletotrichum acutatum]KAK1728968.1 hypothetical protein BDZ83DRAFT_727681 [Colletotrichum acutatum]